MAVFAALLQLVVPLNDAEAAVAAKAKAAKENRRMGLGCAGLIALAIAFLIYFEGYQHAHPDISGTVPAQSDDLLVRDAGAEDAPYFQPAIYVGKAYRVREGWLTQDFAKSAMLAQDAGNDGGLSDLKRSAPYGYLDFEPQGEPDANGDYPDYPRCFVLPQDLRHGNALYDPVECKLVSGDRSGTTIWATWITVRHD